MSLVGVLISHTIPARTCWRNNLDPVRRGKARAQHSERAQRIDDQSEALGGIGALNDQPTELCLILVAMFMMCLYNIYMIVFELVLRRLNDVVCNIVGMCVCWIVVHLFYAFVLYNVYVSV